MGSVKQHDLIRNIGIMAGGLTAPPKNAPGQYAGRKRQYLGAESTAFAKQYAKYSSDFFEALAQGLDTENPKAWETIRMRMADIINPSASMTRVIDDFKMILIGDEAIDYVPPGTKFVTMGSTWLAVNPENISSAYGTGVVQRCRATWNHLDYYGNVVSEPLCVEKALAGSSTPDAQDYMLIGTGYYNIKCQYNDDTAQLGNNSRLILGKSAYKITGFTDFIQEFTGDYDSVKLLEFTVRFEEPNYEIDDMENHVAGGLDFAWDINVLGNATVATGGTSQLAAVSERNGQVVTSTTANPISYIWSSSNENVATVSENGVVTGVGEGACVITCALEQNPSKTKSLAMTVTGTESGNKVAFKGTNIGTLSAYESATVTAAYYVNGVEQTDVTVAWDFDGASEDCYTATVFGNTATFKCWRGSDTDLTVKASVGDYNASQSIKLEGM